MTIDEALEKRWDQHSLMEPPVTIKSEPDFEASKERCGLPVLRPNDIVDMELAVRNGLTTCSNGLTRRRWHWLRVKLIPIIRFMEPLRKKRPSSTREADGTEISSAWCVNSVSLQQSVDLTMPAGLIAPLVSCGGAVTPEQQHSLTEQPPPTRNFPVLDVPPTRGSHSSRQRPTIDHIAAATPGTCDMQQAQSLQLPPPPLPPPPLPPPLPPPVPQPVLAQARETLFLVKSVYGCIVRAGPEITTAKVGKIECGTIVTAGAVCTNSEGTRCIHIAVPSEGWASWKDDEISCLIQAE